MYIFESVFVVSSRRRHTRCALVTGVHVCSSDLVEPENKERIFEPFFTTKSDGMGMGLMFCRSIIEVHGGRLWVTENVPQGTILRFTLPDNEDGASPTERGVQ